MYGAERERGVATGQVALGVRPAHLSDRQDLVLPHTFELVLRRTFIV